MANEVGLQAHSVNPARVEDAFGGQPSVGSGQAPKNRKTSIGSLFSTPNPAQMPSVALRASRINKISPSSVMSRQPPSKKTGQRSAGITQLDAAISGTNGSDNSEIRSLLAPIHGVVNAVYKMHMEMKQMHATVIEGRRDDGSWQEHYGDILEALATKLDVDVRAVSSKWDSKGVVTAAEHQVANSTTSPLLKPSEPSEQGVSEPESPGKAEVLSPFRLPEAAPQDVTASQGLRASDPITKLLHEVELESPRLPRTPTATAQAASSSMPLRGSSSMPPLGTDPFESPILSQLPCAHVSTDVGVGQVPSIDSQASKASLQGLGGDESPSRSYTRSEPGTSSPSRSISPPPKVFSALKSKTIGSGSSSANVTVDNVESDGSSSNALTARMKKAKKHAEHTHTRRGSQRHTVLRTTVLNGRNSEHATKLQRAGTTFEVNDDDLQLQIDESWRTRPTQGRKDKERNGKTYTSWQPTGSADDLHHKSSSGDQAIMRGHSDMMHSPTSSSHHGQHDHPHYRKSVMAKMVLTPGDPKRMAFDMLTGLVLIMEAITTPFTMCFRPPESSSGNITRLFATVFWATDMALTFFTAYDSNGKFVKEPRSIAWHYITSWFFFDVFLISLDTTSLVVTVVSGSGQEDLSGVQTLRLFRIVRLLRLVKLKRIFQEIMRLLSTDSMQLAFAIILRMCVIFLGVHVIACGWYLCATYRDLHTHPNWVRVYSVHEESIYSRYLISLHWAISQVHGTMEVSPQSVVERAYAVVVLLVSLFVMAVLVGNLANLLAKFWSDQNYKARQLWLLRRYMSQLHVSYAVAEKVETYVQDVMVKRLQNVNVESIDILKFLSKPLADELKCDSYIPFLTKHHLFSFCFDRREHGLTLVSFVEAVATSWMSTGDLVFMCGDVEMDMSLLIDGTGCYIPNGKAEDGAIEDADNEFQSQQMSTMGLEPLAGAPLCCPCGTFFMDDANFCLNCGSPQGAPAIGGMNGSEQTRTSTQVEGMPEDDNYASQGQSGSDESGFHPSRSMSSAPGAVTVSAGEWVGEPPLWLHCWIPLGDFEVREACQVARISPSIFKKLVRSRTRLWDIMSQYAVEFVKSLRDADPETLSDLALVVSPEDILATLQRITPSSDVQEEEEGDNEE